MIDLRTLKTEEGVSLNRKNGYFMVIDFTAVPVIISEIQLTISENIVLKYTIKEMLGERKEHTYRRGISVAPITLYESREEATGKIITNLKTERACANSDT